ncbi:hypothetical protein B0H15DRAFT_834045 [Mycena belliarum]|uniref:Uncharacterized protein n=1 Tax=Mycena belliarum TaxID=1033014 RepID=A0AAD6U994_9AGAR|nr:hypothetical protein B0H15DRAFT_834045 [Mycena belliae]
MPTIPGEPKESPKPQPIGGNMPMIFLATACTLCFLFILWRRASALRSVISHQLKTITHPNEGAIRLSEDDGPPAREFLEDDYDEDNEGLNMDDHAAPPIPGQQAQAGAVRTPASPILPRWPDDERS